jgi:hypothetical protein
MIKWSLTCKVLKWTVHTARFRAAGKTLLIINGAKTHPDANTVDAVGDYISLFYLPSICTH